MRGRGDEEGGGREKGKKMTQKVRDRLEQGMEAEDAGDGARTQPDNSDAKTCKVEQERLGPRPSAECPCPLLFSLLLKGSTCFSHLVKGTSPGQVTPGPPQSPGQVTSTPCLRSGKKGTMHSGVRGPGSAQGAMRGKESPGRWAGTLRPEPGPAANPRHDHREVSFHHL